MKYIGKPPWDTGISPPELIEFIRTHQPARALDIGCGTGTNVITLASHGWHAHGVDFVPGAIKTARRKARLNGAQAKFSVQDATRLDSLLGQYELVLDIRCFHSLNETEKLRYSLNLPNLLTQDGTFLLYAWLSLADETMPGLSTKDLDNLGKILLLMKRQDGADRGGRDSAWFWYQKR